MPKQSAFSKRELVDLRAAVAMALGYIDADRNIRKIEEPSVARTSLARAWNNLTERIGDGLVAPAEREP